MTGRSIRMTNLRKAAQMIGMDWNDMGECLVNDRARKRKRGNGLNLKYIPKVLDICKQWRIINISVIISTYSINFGRAFYCF